MKTYLEEIARELSEGSEDGQIEGWGDVVNDISSIADFLIKRLKKEGFIIQRYDSYTTSSIYLKLDYGVCNSIRISDHRGKKHLQYRYNVLKTQEKVHRGKSSQGWDRNYYGFKKKNLESLLKDIQKDKENKLRRWGEVKYKNYMVKNKREGENSYGFWSSCIEV